MFIKLLQLGKLWTPLYTSAGLLGADSSKIPQTEGLTLVLLLQVSIKQSEP